VYNKKAPASQKEMYLKINTTKKGNMQTAISQLVREIQFLLSLKMLMRENASE
jgi:hypothetical protein